jgi:hypothetical protein
MKCPRCGLLNPEQAQRCDCGYDFKDGIVKKAYFKQGLPRGFKTYVILVVVLNILAAVAAVASGKIANLAGALLWSILIWWLYTRLVQKRNWARLALIVLTFPVGLLLGLSREARLYCLQK